MRCVRKPTLSCPRAFSARERRNATDEAVPIQCPLTCCCCLTQKAKQDKKSNENVFSFLVDPKDVRPLSVVGQHGF